MKKLKNKFLLICIVMNIILMYSYNVNSANLPIDNPEVYNPISVTFQHCNNCSIGDIGGVVLNKSGEYISGGFYIDGNVNISMDLYLVFSILTNETSEVNFAFDLLSKKSDGTEYFSWNLYNNEPISLSSIAYTFKNMIVPISAGDFDNFDILNFLLLLTDNDIYVIIISVDLYYGVEQMDYVVNNYSFTDSQIYLIFMFVLMITNIFVLKSITKNENIYKIMFMVVGFLYGGFGLLYSDLFLTPFLQIFCAFYSILMNIPAKTIKER